ncbi:MAG: flavodoxin-dependent (E)-4-hydroxy-3-methylbut-2-enyl-diphosphate synthase, partial [Planctomycetia bacterium]
MKRNPTRAVRIGSITIGAGHPIAAQSMTATHTTDVAATLEQANALHAAGAGVVRIAVDSKKDAAALPAIRAGTAANDCALRVGVNCGSVDPAKKEKFAEDDSIGPMLASALEHCELLDAIGFTRYAVSLKDSDPRKVIDVNRRFAEARPDVPLHLGVTEAGMPPDGIIKTRIAFEQLISRGIGDTVRVSLTVPNADKPQEIAAAKAILADIAAGRVRSVVDYGLSSLNIISCPSCSRVENEAFIELAKQVKDMTAYARDHKITIAVMGCRVNGPGETDDAVLAQQTEHPLAVHEGLRAAEADHRAGAPAGGRIDRRHRRKRRRPHAAPGSRGIDD